MTLNERITEDMKAAMKSGSTLRLSTLRTLRAQLVELSKRSGKTEITPDDELAVLSTAVKKRQEAIELFEKGGRSELAAKERDEIAIIKDYLPPQLSPAEILSRVDEIIARTGSSTPQDIKKVMGVVMRELKGRADGALVSELVRQKLGG